MTLSHAATLVANSILEAIYEAEGTPVAQELRNILDMLVANQSEAAQRARPN